MEESKDQLASEAFDYQRIAVDESTKSGVIVHFNSVQHCTLPCHTHQ